MGKRIKDNEDWEALQDEIADSNARKRGTGQVFPNMKVKRRTEARKALLIREKRKGRGKW